jgi:hypothetical protein
VPESAQLQAATLATAPAGSYPITVTGTSGSLSHSVMVTLTVYTRDFGVSVNPSSVTVTRGRTATYTVSVTVVGGFTGPVTLKVTGQPTGTSETRHQHHAEIDVYVEDHRHSGARRHQVTAGLTVR